MSQLPTLVVCGLALLLLLESGRGSDSPGLVVPGPQIRGLEGLVVAPARLDYSQRSAGARLGRVSWIRGDQSVRIEAPDGVRSAFLRDTPVEYARLALPGLLPEELLASRPTGRSRTAFGLAFEERVLERPAGRLELWWSRELGAPLRVVRDLVGSREELDLEAVDGLPPGRRPAN